MRKPEHTRFRAPMVSYHIYRCGDHVYDQIEHVLGLNSDNLTAPVRKHVYPLATLGPDDLHLCIRCGKEVR